MFAFFTSTCYTGFDDGPKVKFTVGWSFFSLNGRCSLQMCAFLFALSMIVAEMNAHSCSVTILHHDYARCSGHQQCT
jgi:hypothetical protein